MSFSQARAFINAWHRHHRPPPGHKYSIGAADDHDTLIGVAGVGRPVAATSTTGSPSKSPGLATDGTRNTCSLLYAACWQAAKALGYRRLVTYTHQHESGASLRAAGWQLVAELPPRRGWSTPSRPRADHGTDQIARHRWQVTAHTTTQPPH